MSIDIEALAKRVEAASGPDRELDAEIDAALNGGRASHTFTDVNPASRLRRSYSAGTVFDHTDPQTNGRHVLLSMVRHALPVTGSLDAAMTLVPKGWWLDIKTGTQVHAPSFEWPVVAIGRQTSNRVIWHGQAKSIPLTITAAALRARAAKDKA